MEIQARIIGIVLPQNFRLLPQIFKVCPKFCPDFSALPRRDLDQTCHVFQTGPYRPEETQTRPERAPTRPEMGPYEPERAPY